MKDGHMWKSVIISYSNLDSAAAGDTKWDSVIGARCGDRFRPATLKDYYNTDFEYIEHSTVVGTVVGGASGYIMPSTSADTDSANVADCRGTFCPWPASLYGVNIGVHLVIDIGYLRFGYGGLTSKDNIRDSIATIPFGHGFETITGGHLVACISDTMYGTKPSIDTVSLIKMDTIYNVDTIRINQVDTVYKMDTVSLVKTDTITLNREIHDTIVVVNPHTIVDTSVVVRYDTIVKLNTDTVRITDTVDIVTHDTVNTCRDGTLGQYYEKLSKAKGTYSNTGLTIVEMEPEVSPSVEVQTDSYVEIQAYIYDNLGVAVSSRKYTLRPSARQYIAFGGYSDSGLKVPSGVYLMRIVSRHNGAISNNVYRVGISD